MKACSRGTAALFVTLVIAGFTAGASAQLHVSYDPEGDGTYQKAATYEVSYEDALRAFMAAGGAPWDGTGTVLNAREVPGVSFDGPQSWDGFVAFLEARYENALDRGLQDCGAVIQVDLGSLRWSCAGLQCIPVDECEGFFAGATANFRCLNIPPCPTPPAMMCLPVADWADIVAFNTTGGTACTCDGPNCVHGTGTPDGTGLMHVGDVCKCFFPAPAPFHSLADTVVLFNATDVLEPGAAVDLIAQVPAAMILGRGDTRTDVELLTATIAIQISPDIDEYQTSTFEVIGGGGQFAPFEFEGIPVPLSDFVIEQGSGTIYWPVGQFMTELHVRVSAPGFEDVTATAAGSGMADFALNTVEMQFDAMGFQYGLIPTVSQAGLIVMTMLLLTAGTIVYARRRHRSSARPGIYAG
ncbi:MAG: hypothetical protein KAY37_12760 [Phycisphaerae bacterium]|nr:hypothetical protein [Phycisphaerae bacterium]